jgi:hypothetical protein
LSFSGNTKTRMDQLTSTKMELMVVDLHSPNPPISDPFQ